MIIKRIQADFSICKVTDYSEVDFDSPFYFLSRTDEENSLVCMTESRPQNTIECDTKYSNPCGILPSGNVIHTLTS
jgi:hypothetical protein